jgi:hypothetical protein
MLLIGYETPISNRPTSPWHYHRPDYNKKASHSRKLFLFDVVARQCHVVLLNNTLIWNQQDLQKKLDAYQDYFNRYRSHSAIHAMTPENKSSGNQKVIDMNHHKWKKYLRGLIQLPIAI